MKTKRKSAPKKKLLDALFESNRNVVVENNITSRNVATSCILRAGQ